MALANMYNYSSLEDVGKALENDIHGIIPADAVARITAFIERLHKEEHVDNDAHQRNVESLEKLFHANNFGSPESTEHSHLSARPGRIHCAEAGVPARKTTGADELERELQEDGERFKKEHVEHCQFIFSRAQHHWHNLDKGGKRQPMRCCQQEGRGKRGCCRAGLPKMVVRDERGNAQMSKCRVRVACAGVAAEMNLRTSGRGNMLGAVLGRRRREWFSGASVFLAHLTRSNTDVQCPRRLPNNEHAPRTTETASEKAARTRACRGCASSPSAP